MQVTWVRLVKRLAAKTSNIRRACAGAGMLHGGLATGSVSRSQRTTMHQRGRGEGVKAKEMKSKAANRRTRIQHMSSFAKSICSMVLPATRDKKGGSLYHLGAWRLALEFRHPISWPGALHFACSTRCFETYVLRASAWNELVRDGFACLHISSQSNAPQHAPHFTRKEDPRTLLAPVSLTSSIAGTPRPKACYVRGYGLGILASP